MQPVTKLLIVGVSLLIVLVLLLWGGHKLSRRAAETRAASEVLEKERNPAAEYARQVADYNGLMAGVCYGGVMLSIIVAVIVAIVWL